MLTRVARTFSMGPAEFMAGLAWTATCLAVLFVTSPSSGAGVSHEADAAAVAIVLLTTLPLALRRRFPIAVAVLVTPISIYGSLHGYAVSLTALGALFALASAAYYADRRTTIAIGLYAVLALLVGSVIAGGPLLSVQLLVSNLASPLLAVAVGDALRSRRDYARRWRERAHEVEALGDADQARAVAQERVRMAGEVHDVVGHRLAAITVQARAARRRVQTDPARAADALAEIDELATRALAETRRAVGEIGDADEPAPTQPVGAG